MVNVPDSGVPLLTGVPQRVLPDWYRFFKALARVAGDALPAGDYTAADVLAKLLTVDGTGSGLDADTVDGLHAENGTYTPTVTATSGTITSVTGAQGAYLKVGRFYACVFSFTIADNGTGSGFQQVTLPAVVDVSIVPTAGTELSAGNSVVGATVGGSSTLTMYNSGGGYPGGTGKIIAGFCFFRAAS